MQQSQWPKIIIWERNGGEWGGGGIMRNGDGGNGKLHDILTTDGTDGVLRLSLRTHAHCGTTNQSLRKKIFRPDGTILPYSLVHRCIHTFLTDDAASERHCNSSRARWFCHGLTCVALRSWMFGFDAPR